MIASKGAATNNHQQDSASAFSQVSAAELLDTIKRPVLVLDLDFEATRTTETCLQPVYVNRAFSQSSHLLDAVLGKFDRDRFADGYAFDNFVHWARKSDSNAVRADYVFLDSRWEFSDLNARWRVITVYPLVNQSFKNSPAQFKHDDLSPRHLEVGDHQSLSNVTTPLEQFETAVQNSREYFSLPRDSESTENVLSTIPENRVSISPSVHSPNSTVHKAKAQRAKLNADLLSRISAFPTVGIYITDKEGEILFCSDAWYDITQYPRENTNAMEWINVFLSDEIPRVFDIWQRVTQNQEPIFFEARLKRHWTPPAQYEGVPSDYPVWISAYVCPEVSEDGVIVGAGGVLADITEQKWTARSQEQKLFDAVERANLLEQLASHEQRFQRLADFMPVGIWMHDQDGKVFYTNRNYHRLTSMSQEKETIEPWLRQLAEEDYECVKGQLERLWTDRFPFSFEVCLGSRQGMATRSPAHTNFETWILVSVYPEVEDRDTVKHVVGCITDISDFKRAELADRQEVQRQLESKRQLEHFIDMTSHEMRNPLSAIVHSADDIIGTLDQGEESSTLTAIQVESILDAARTILYCTSHSTRIVDDILTVSKLESKLLEISPTNTQIVPTVQGAFEMFSAEFKSADISASFTVDNSIRNLGIEWVRIDPTRVLQVFVNLITNAIKFTRTRSRRRIDVVLGASEQRPTAETSDVHYLPSETSNFSSRVQEMDTESTVFLRVAVTDTGCGLTDEEQTRLFVRFSQAQTRTHVQYGGTGLGLFISRQLCEMQDGQIGIRSVAGEGSTFAFYVAAPRVAPNSPALSQTWAVSSPNPNPRSPDGRTIQKALSPAPTSSSGPTTRSQTTQPQPDIKILLVEDNLLNQKVMQQQLLRKGFSVRIANNGVEALARLNNSTLVDDAEPDDFAVVLLDLEMPVMGGLECVRRVRDLQSRGMFHHHVPVIAVTANARAEQITEAKDAGMDDVITKPFRIHELIPLIHHLIAQYPSPPRSGG